MNDCTLLDPSPDCLMSNGSEEVHILLQGPAYLILNVVLLFIFTAALLIDSLAIGTLVMKSAIFISLRILLINLLAAEIAAALSGMITVFTSLVLLLTDNVTPSLIACRVIVWLIALSIAGRVCSLVAYSVAVYCVIKQNKKSLKVTFSISAVIIIWTLSLIFTTDRLIPQTAGVRFLEDVHCVPFSGDGVAILELRIVLRLFWVTFAGFLPFLISIAIPVAGLCHIKRALGTDDPIYVKAMMKLGLFLVLAESFAFAGMLVLTIIPFLSQTQQVANVVAIYILSITITLSILPTPILIFVTLRGTRTNLHRMLTCCCQMDSGDDAHNNVLVQVNYRKVAD